MEPKAFPALGFLTVVEHELGLVGGYLVLNATGRPLEFHCTAPVKPNRAQQILFGPTLEPYLYGEQIGQTLLNKGSVAPGLVCTDSGPVLAVRDYTTLPVALVLTKQSPPADGNGDAETQTTWRIDRAHCSPQGLSTFQLGENRLAVAAHREADRPEILKHLEALERFDLAEPFERIREAIEEANRGGSP